MCGHAFYVRQIEMEKSTQISKNWTRIRRVWYCAVRKRFFFCCGVFIFEKSTHTQSETVEEKRRNCNNHKSHMSWVLLCVFLALFLSLSFSFRLYIYPHASPPLLFPLSLVLVLLFYLYRWDMQIFVYWLPRLTTRLFSFILYILRCFSRLASVWFGVQFITVEQLFFFVNFLHYCFFRGIIVQLERATGRNKS